jgi:hypothetical protein
MTTNGSTGFYTMVMQRGLLSCLCFLMSLMASAEPGERSAVINTLNAVPVYFVTTASDAAPAVGAQQQADFVPVFLYSQEADIAKAELEREGATQLKVVRSELGILYSGKLSANNNGIRYGLVANPTQLAAARRLAANANFLEVPIFVAKHKQSGEVMTTKQPSGTLTIPLFLEVQRLESALVKLGKQLPDLAGEFRVEAYPLSRIVDDMSSGTLDPQQVQMIPPTD